MQRLAVIATGGTVSMRGPGDGVQAPLRGSDLLGLCPTLTQRANCQVHDILSMASSGFGLNELSLIATTVLRCSDASGIVILHGTDTLAETAFLLTCVTQIETPIVLTGAMRRSDQLGSDGAANFEAAGLVALSDDARGKGVLVAMDDEIHAAALVRKTHSFRTHAFSSAPWGPIGWVRERNVRFALAPALRFPQLVIGGLRPVVAVLEGGPAMEASVIAAVGTVAHGLVLSLSGAGHVSAECVPLLEDLAARIPVVFASRTGSAGTLASSYRFAGSETDLITRGLIPSGALDSAKTKILLLLLLSNGASLAHIRNVFAELP